MGAATNKVQKVPIATPKRIEKVKLRIDAPPRMKTINITRNVVKEVFNVRANVLLRALFITEKRSLLG